MLTFCEHQCDAMLPYSGGYSETTFDPAAAAKAGADPPYRLWSDVGRWEVYRWLVPGAQMGSRLYEVKGKIPRDTPPDAFFRAHEVTPLVPVNDFPTRLPALQGAKSGKKKPTEPAMSIGRLPNDTGSRSLFSRGDLLAASGSCR